MEIQKIARKIAKLERKLAQIQKRVSKRNYGQQLARSAVTALMG